MEPGHLFGEWAIVTDTMIRNSTVIAGRFCKKCQGTGQTLRRQLLRPCGKCAQAGFRSVLDPENIPLLAFYSCSCSCFFTKC